MDGGNGMAGTMVGPILDGLDLDLETLRLGAGRQHARRRAQPAAPREPPDHHGQGHGDRRRPRHRLGRRRRPLLLHRRQGPLRRRRLPHRAAGAVRAREAARRDDPLRRPRLPRRRRHRRGGRRHRARQPRRPRLLQDPDARRRRRLRRRGLRPLLLRRVLQRGLRHDPGAADPRAALQARREAVGADRRLPLGVLHLRRDQLRGRRRRRQDGRARGALRRRRRSPSSTASPSTTRTGTSTCARPTPSRCCG